MLRRLASFVLAVILLVSILVFIGLSLSLWFESLLDSRSPKPSEIVFLCGGLVLTIGLMAPIARLVRYTFCRQNQRVFRR